MKWFSTRFFKSTAFYIPPEDLSKLGITCIKSSTKTIIQKPVLRFIPMANIFLKKRFKYWTYNKLLRTGLIEEIEGSTVKYFAKPFL